MTRPRISLSLPLCAAALLLALNTTTAHAAEAPADAKAQAADIERARAEFKRAREELARAAREMARVSRELHLDNPRAFAYEFVGDPDRAMLGVTIANAKAKAKDGKRAGVRATGVTPGSGADEAGLKSGDLLFGANGAALAADADDEREPVQRLREVMDGLKPGDKVRIDYERDGRRASTTVTASRPQEAVLRMLGWQDDEDFDVLIPPLPPHAPGAAPAFRHGGADIGLQLARIDDDLAAYFKTRDGVLVVRAPDGGTLGLKSGDVIRKINDRSVASPVAAWEELADAKDQPVKMTVLRQGKELALEGKLPESGRRHIERRIVIEKDGDE